MCTQSTHHEIGQSISTLEKAGLKRLGTHVTYQSVTDFFIYEFDQAYFAVTQLMEAAASSRR